MKNYELINDLKDLICAACLDIVFLQLGREEASKDLKILLKTQKNLQNSLNAINSSINQDDFFGLKNNIESSLKIISEKEIIFKKRTKKLLKNGKNKIFAPISIEILKAIDICEVNEINLEWLKVYLIPNGELYKDIKKSYPNMTKILLPIPTHATNDKQWIHRLKETLQRSLFSNNDKVIKVKTDEFLKTRLEFYENIRSGNDEIYEYHKLKRC